MFKKLIKKYTPDHETIKNEKSISFISKYLSHTNIWRLNRYSVSMAFSTGLFAALVPLPFQMLIAAVLAILFGANLPISMGLTWVSNPFTTPAIAYLCYKVGAFVLEREELQFNFEFSWVWLKGSFYTLGVPFLVGSFIVAILVSLLSNFLIRITWRFYTVIAWKINRSKYKKVK